MKITENIEKNSDMEMLDEYNFDYSKGKPNKFAKDFYKSTINVYNDGKLIKKMKPVLLDSDIVRHFKTSKRINNALKSLIKA